MLRIDKNTTFQVFEEKIIRNDIYIYTNCSLHHGVPFVSYSYLNGTIFLPLL